MTDALKTAALFDLDKTLAKPYLETFEFPWQALPGLTAFIAALGERLPKDEYDEIAPGVWVAGDAVVAPSAFLAAPCVIGHGAEIRHCAFIRGGALVGAGAVVGNSTELKNCVLFDGAQAPHYNYIGDSILGAKAHMGAGAVTSNLKGDKTPVVVRAGNTRVETGLRKFGAMLGDRAEIGCGAVLNPGTVIGRDTQVYPLCFVRGAVPAGGILKNNGTFVFKEAR